MIKKRTTRRAKQLSTFSYQDIHLGLAFLVLLFMFTGILWKLSAPRMGQAVLAIEGQRDATVQLPAFFSRKSENMTFRIPVTVPLLASGHLRIIPDDCVTSIFVNGRQVTGSQGAFCGPMVGVDVDLSGYLKHGENTLVIGLRDNGGNGGVHVSFPRDSWYLRILLCAAAAAVFLFLLFSARSLGYRVSRPVSAVLLLGIVARIFNAVSTSPFLRAYDAWGHREYILYILHNWSVPAADKGWEFYQAPLYYFLAAAWAKAAVALGLDTEGGLVSVQWLAFLLSVLTLGLFWILARQLLKSEKQQALFLLIPSTLPAWVFFSYRMTNDVLVLPLSVLCLYFLVRWWQSPRLRMFLLVAVTAGLASLTKSTGFLLFPVVFVLPLFRFAKRKNFILVHWVTAGLIILAVAGWFHIPRVLEERDAARFLVRNIVASNPGLRVVTSVSHLTVFNPAKIVSHPYNNTWADGDRRQYFLEFLYKSAFWGEYNLGENLALIAKQILIIGMILSAVGFYGMGFDIWNFQKAHRPMLFTALSFMIGHFIYRILVPFSPAQDFRFSMILLAPFSYYLLKGIERIPSTWRIFFHVLLVVFALQNFLVLLSLSTT